MSAPRSAAQSRWARYSVRAAIIYFSVSAFSQIKVNQAQSRSIKVKDVSCSRRARSQSNVAAGIVARTRRGARAPSRASVGASPTETGVRSLAQSNSFSERSIAGAAGSGQKPQITIMTHKASKPRASTASWETAGASAPLSRPLSRVPCHVSPSYSQHPVFPGPRPSAFALFAPLRGKSPAQIKPNQGQSRSRVPDAPAARGTNPTWWQGLSPEPAGERARPRAHRSAPSPTGPFPFSRRNAGFVRQGAASPSKPENRIAPGMPPETAGGMPALRARLLADTTARANGFKDDEKW
jgi:hypothetical protein